MEQLRLSRNTIVYAFERLVTEGYLESKPGSGTYVAPVHGGMHGRDTGDVRSRTRSYGQRRLSARAAVLAGSFKNSRCSLAERSALERARFHVRSENTSTAGWHGRNGRNNAEEYSGEIRAPARTAARAESRR